MKDRPSLETTPLSRATLEGMRRARRTPPSVAIFVYRSGGVDQVPLRAGTPLVFGRDEAADYGISDPSLSRRHARLSLVGESVTVEDLGSTNGTWVAGERVERAELRPGDEVTLGAVVLAIHAASADGALRSLDGDVRFRAAIADEIARARWFGRNFSLLMLRAPEGEPPVDRARPRRAAAPSAHGRKSDPPASARGAGWHARLLARLRPIDRASVYSADALQVLVPEAGADEARVIADSFTVRSEVDGDLCCGIAVFPDAGTTAEELVAAAHRAGRQAGVERRVVVAPGQRALELVPGAHIGSPWGRVVQSAAMREVWETAGRVARSQIPVLCVGETGVGKELVARAIHEGGARSDRPMISVNCGAIPSQLLESTLFGHEKGAFTGATQQHKGVFEAADGGTVFLDEVGELPLLAQAALLRVLETRRVTRVGSTREIDVDVRVVAATHRDVEAMADAGTFRMDLLYRLNAITILVPPLRERPEEVEPLARAFLGEASRIEGRKLRSIEPDALELMRAYPWPGNVRELKNAIERAVVVAREERVTVRDLPDRVRSPRLPAAPAAPTHAAAAAPAPPAAPVASVPPPPLVEAPVPAAPAPRVPASNDVDLRARMMQHEAEVIVEVLRACGWSQTEAAKKLGLPLRTLVHKIKAHGIKKLGYTVPTK